MAYSVSRPFPYFTDANGAPLDRGYVYIGSANQNPQTNPLSVYWDADGTVTAAQPLRTSGGYFYRNGTPANVYVTNSDYSITVRDSAGKLVYSNLSQAYSASSSLISFIASGADAVVRSAQDKMRDTVSVKDYGAVGDSTTGGVGTDDTAAFEAAIAACSGTERLYIPAGLYKISDTLVLPESIEIEFDANASLVFTKTGAYPCLSYGVTGQRYQSGLRILRPSILLVDDESWGMKFLNALYVKLHDTYIEGQPGGTNVGIWWAATTGIDSAWNHLAGTTRLNHCHKGILSPVGSAPYDGLAAQWTVDYLVYYGDYNTGDTTSIAVDMGGGSNSIFLAGYIEQCGKGFALSGLLTNGIRVSNMVFDHCYEIVNLGSDVTGQTENFILDATCFIDTGWENYTDSTVNGNNYIAFAMPIPAPHGIQFPATQVASTNPNVLDDYEEGTWTPVLGGSSSVSSNGRYRKIGSFVWVEGYIDAVNSLGTGSTTTISGLPFTSASTGIFGTGSVSYFASLATNVLFLSCYVENSASTMRFVSATTSTATATLAPAIFGNGATVYFAACYQSAS